MAAISMSRTGSERFLAADEWALHDALGPREDVVRVFDEVPELLDTLDSRTADLLRRRVAVPKLWVDAGPWVPPERTATGAELGLLVVSGLFVRTVELDGRECPELVGAGDLLRPWDDMERTLDHRTSWTALARGELAVLDGRFASVIARWPSVIDDVLARLTERSRSLAFQLAIVHVRYADLRLHMLFWHLADRWGRVTRDGVHLPLPLTHEMLAQLACMRRPTASSALQRLVRRGEIARRRDGTWLLTGTPPASGSRRVAPVQSH